MANSTSIESIEQWFADAQELAISLLGLMHWRWHTQIQADAKVDSTLRQLAILAEKSQSLEDRFAQVWPGLKLAYCDLGDFSCEGLPPDRCAWLALNSLTERVVGWGKYLAVEQQKRTLNCGEVSEWMDREAWLRKTVHAIRARLLLEESKLRQLNFAQVPAKGAKSKTSGRRRRKANELTNAQEALASAVEAWHEYGSLSCGRLEPISYSRLIHDSGVKSKSSVKKFFDSWLGGNEKYKRLCKAGDAKALAFEIAKLTKTGALALFQYSGELLADSKANSSGVD